MIVKSIINFQYFNVTFIVIATISALFLISKRFPHQMHLIRGKIEIIEGWELWDDLRNAKHARAKAVILSLCQVISSLI